jgi:glycosyltransferase involved in cell wall biosynthesis
MMRAMQTDLLNAHQDAPVILFGSTKPVTCAVMDYSHRLIEAINRHRPGTMCFEAIEPDEPGDFLRRLKDRLADDRTVHFQLPVEGWGNALLPGSALAIARAMVPRRGRIVMTLHEWTSLNNLRYLSMVPDVLATDGFIFVSAAQREIFLKTPLVSRAKKSAAPVIPIGPNIMPKAIDPAITARERDRLTGDGATKAEIIIGFFGVLYASKRPEVLLETLKALHDGGTRARLLVCGDFLWDKPQDREAFFAVARALGMMDWLDFRGRIDDEVELVSTLAASDVFLLPYSDGLSTRRGSFQAIANLARPLVSTMPERADEFDATPLLKQKIDRPATVLCAVNADGKAFAQGIIKAHAARNAAVGVDLTSLWDDAAQAHLAFYDAQKKPMATNLHSLDQPHQAV